MEYTTVEAMAQKWKVDPETVRRWCRNGRIMGAIRMGRKWKIPITYLSGETRVDFQKTQEEKETQD